MIKLHVLVYSLISIVHLTAGDFLIGGGYFLLALTTFIEYRQQSGPKA